MKDSETYKILPENGDEKVMAKLKKSVNQHKSILTKKEIDYLTKFEFKTNHFYGLPKVHQSSRIKETVMESLRKWKIHFNIDYDKAWQT